MDEIKEKDFLVIVDQVIKTNKKFEKDKLKLYCEYCLSLGKEYLNSIIPNLYEACEKINIRNNMEGFEKQIKLGIEAINICEEILKYIEENDIMKIYKAKVFCEFFLCYKLDGVDTTEIKEKCKKYLEKFDNFSRNYNYELFDYFGNRYLFDLSGKKIKKI